MQDAQLESFGFWSCKLFPTKCQFSPCVLLCGLPNGLCEEEFSQKKNEVNLFVRKSVWMCR